MTSALSVLWQTSGSQDVPGDRESLGYAAAPSTLGQTAPSISDEEIFISDSIWNSRQPVIFQVTEAAFERMSGPLERIRGFVDLESDWDSYGASRIQPKAVLQAIQLLTKIAQNDVTVPAVVPTSAGGFQLEWHRAQADLELEVQPNGSVRVFLQMPNGQTWEGPLANSQWRLEEFLRQVDRS